MSDVHDLIEAEDGDLVRRFQAGEVGGYAELLRRYQPAVYLFLCRMSGSASEAEDLAQETFVRVYDRLAQLERPDRFRSWLWAIASNLCRDHHKALRHRQHLSLEYDIDLDRELASPSREGSIDVGGRIRAAIDALDENHRLVVVLREYHHLSYNDIAEIAGCAVSTVRWRLHEARLRLRKDLADLLE